MSSEAIDSKVAEPSRNDRYHDEQLHRRNCRNRVMLVITFICAAAYFVWAVLNMDYGQWYASVPYLVAEFLCLISLMLWSGMMIHRREHDPHGLPLPEKPEAVDIIVTCCGEPIQVIEKTLRAVAEINYPNYDVTVADDRSDAEVGALCEELGFKHLCRSEHEDRKAGNLNYAYERTSHPFLLTLDCDQIPHASILNKLMGYFTLPYIGFVTAYQGFDVPQGDPWGNRDRVFYGAMQLARDDCNSAISCGSGVVYRRAALDDIGGFSTWNMVEDLYSSLLMHNAGWKSVYYPFPVAHGTAPAEISGHVKQRWQWAVDSMRLFIWRNPMFTKGLSWHQKLNYTSFGYNYVVFGIAYPIFFLLPIWGLLSGSFFMDTTATEFITWRAPYAIAYVIFNKMITGRRHNRKTFRAQTGLFAVFLSAIVTALFSRNHVPRYKVTSKLTGHPRLMTRIGYVIPHLIIIALCACGIIYGRLTLEPTSAIYLINTVWAFWIIWLLLPFTWIALKPPPEIDFR